MSRSVAFFEGFQYQVKEKPLLGAYVAMANLARGFLKHGRLGDYHTFFDDGFFAGLASDEISRLRRCPSRLRWKTFQSLLIEPQVDHVAVNCDSIVPDRQVLFKRLLTKKNTPFVRTMYTIATNAHLREILDLCLLEQSGRSYDALVLLSEPTKTAVSSFLSDLADRSEGRLQYKGQLRVIPPGVDQECLVPHSKLRARRELGLPAAATILMSNARISDVSKMNYPRVS